VRALGVLSRVPDVSFQFVRTQSAQASTHSPMNLSKRGGPIACADSFVEPVSVDPAPGGAPDQAIGTAHSTNAEANHNAENPEPGLGILRVFACGRRAAQAARVGPCGVEPCKRGVESSASHNRYRKPSFTGPAPRRAGQPRPRRNPENTPVESSGIMNVIPDHLLKSTI